MSFETYQSVAEQAAADQQLALLRDSLSRQHYPGYPEQADRLVADPAALPQTAEGRLVLPDGPWTVDAHSRQPLREIEPSADRQAELVDQGYVLDSRGRPLHPWFLKMVADPLIGVVLGKGTNWEWGANRTVDGVVVKRGHVLLIRRGDTGELALPGGFVDPREAVETTLGRELAEETGLEIPESAQISQVYQGPVADIRATAHAWPETTAFLVQLDDDGPLPEVTGMDDAAAAAWVPLESLGSEDPAFFGSHRFLLAQALGHLELSQTAGD